MNSILFLGYSRLVQRKLILAARSSGFNQIEVSTNRQIEDIPNVKVHKGHEQALEKSSSSLAYVSMVNSDHGKWARKVIESGRHCIVDKPSFSNEKEARELTSLAQSKNLLLAEATVWTEHPQSSQLLNIFETERPKKVVALFTMPPFEPENFRWNKNLGGGSLYDLGPYMSSTGRFIFGGTASKVHAYASNFKNDVPVSFGVQATWPCGGILIGLFGFDSEYLNRIEIIGRNGHASLQRAFTTPPDLVNTIKFSQNNQTHDIQCVAADAFACFFEKIKKSIQKDCFSTWHQNILDDAKTLSLLFESTNEEQLESKS